MRLLVSGASGFVGGWLLRLLLAEGHEVFAGSPDGEPPPGAEPVLLRARWTALDVTSGESVAAAVRVARPEGVFHLAGQASVGGSFADPRGTWDVNAAGTLRLVRALAAEARGARLLLASSAEVYGEIAEGAQPIPETVLPSPANPYAASKAAAEMVVAQASAAGEVRGVVARSFNHTGPGQDPRFAIASFARQLAAMGRGEAEPVLRVGNLEARRDFLDVRDVVRAYRLLLERGEPGGTYNVCSGVAHRLREVVDRMVALSGTGARVEVDPERVRPVDVPLLLGDAGRLRALGWEPEVPLERTLGDLLESA